MTNQTETKTLATDLASTPYSIQVTAKGKVILLWGSGMYQASRIAVSQWQARTTVERIEAYRNATDGMKDQRVAVIAYRGLPAQPQAAVLADLYGTQHPTLDRPLNDRPTHVIRWTAYVDGGPIARQSHMKPVNGYHAFDASCSCGWSTHTGGALQARIDSAVQDHKWEMEG